MAIGTASLCGMDRLSVGNGYTRRYLLPELAGLRLHYPDIQVELATDDHNVDRVCEGFGIVVRGAMLVHASVVSRRVCQLATV